MTITAAERLALRKMTPTREQARLEAAVLRAEEADDEAAERVRDAAPALLEACEAARAAILQAAQDTLWAGEHVTVVDTLDGAIQQARGAP